MPYSPTPISIKHPPLLIPPQTPQMVNKRLVQVIKKLITDGHDIMEISKYTSHTVVDLLNGVEVKRQRPIWMGLKDHYAVSLLWLWTGQGDMFIHPVQAQSITPLGKDKVLISR